MKCTGRVIDRFLGEEVAINVVPAFGVGAGLRKRIHWFERKINGSNVIISGAHIRGNRRRRRGRI